MHDAAHRVRALLLEYAQSVVARLAAVDDERLAHALRRRDVAPEARALPLELPGAAVVVEPGLADGDDPRIGGQAGELFLRGLRVLAVVGVHAHRGEHAAITLRIPEQDRVGFEVDARAQHVPHARLARAREHRLEVLPLGFHQIEVAVGIDQLSHLSSVIRQCERWALAHAGVGHCKRDGVGNKRPGYWLVTDDR